jgi:hypothetical protein
VIVLIWELSSYFCSECLPRDSRKISIEINRFLTDLSDRFGMTGFRERQFLVTIAVWVGGVGVAKKKAKASHAIGDKKKRGEWVELRFMAEAAERDLPASKPLGDSENFDVVVGRPGRFVGVQVKCTVFRAKNGDGYVCSMCSSHKVYRPGSFDFAAAYVVPEKVWYIMPAKEVMGMRSVTLASATGCYEEYREAWELLREATGAKESESSENEDARSVQQSGVAAEAVESATTTERRFPGDAVERMEAAMNFARRQMERGLKRKKEI